MGEDGRGQKAKGGKEAESESRRPRKTIHCIEVIAGKME